MKTTIVASVNDQTLRIYSLPKLASGGVDEIEIKVEFSSEWDDTARTAVFYRDKGKVYQVVMVDDKCTIPYEVMMEPGKVYFGLMGVQGGTVHTSEVVALTVQQGAIVAAVAIPLPDVYTQILEAYGKTAQALKVERARIDNLIKNGGTSDDAELVDIRVGYDGTTHASAGEAVRALGEEVEVARFNAVRSNLINIDRSEFGYYSASGVWQSGYSNLEMTTEYIEVVSGDKYTLSMEYPSTAMYSLAYVAGESVPGSWARILFYDAEKNLLNSTDYSFVDRRGVYTVTAPDGAGYVRVCWRHYFTPMLIKLEHGDYATAIQPDTSAALGHEGYYTTEGAVAIDPDTAPYTTKRSLPVEVEGGVAYTVYNLGEATGDRWAAIAFYDEAGDIIERLTYSTVTGNDVRQITTPENAVCAGLTARIDHLVAFTMYKTVSEREKTLEQHYLDLYLAQLNASARSVRAAVAEPVKAVAHRGFSSGAPENTLPAYRLAKQNGFDYAECDVSFTSDGVAVLLHDNTVDRTSDGTGNVADMTLEKLRALDFGSWYSAEYAGTTIPTLDEFLLFCRNVNLKPYIELKAGTQEQIVQMVETVRSYGLTNAVTWISYSAAYLGFVKEVCGYARLGFVVGSVTADTITTVQGLRTGENEVFIDSSTYTDAEVALCKNAGFPLEIWTVNSAETIKALPAYVSGVTSDSQHAGNVLREYSMN